jgi:hypothetical protein
MAAVWQHKTARNWQLRDSELEKVFWLQMGYGLRFRDIPPAAIIRLAIVHTL